MKKDYRHEMAYRDDWKKLTGPLPVKMTNDYLFRALLQADEKTLKAMVASVLHIRVQDVTEIVVTNPIELGETVDSKELHLDVSVILNEKDKINIEMQASHYEGWSDRTLIYLCRSFDSLNHGQDYREVQRAIQVSFTDFTLFPDAPEFFSIYMLVNKNKPAQIYSDKLSIINIDLTNIGLAAEEDRRYGVDRWAKIFKADSWEELKMLATEDKTTEQAVSSIWQLTDDRFIREEMLRREDNEREYRYLLEQAEKAKKVDVLEKTVFEQSSKISEQSSKISEQSSRLAEKDSKISEQNSKISEQEKRIAELEALLAEKDK